MGVLTKWCGLTLFIGWDEGEPIANIYIFFIHTYIGFLLGSQRHFGGIMPYSKRRYFENSKKVYTNPDMVGIYTACYGKDGCDDDESGGQ